MKKTFILLLYIFLLSACSSTSEKAKDNLHIKDVVNRIFSSSAEKCLEPLTEFAFPAGDSSGISAPEYESILPSDGWVLITTAPLREDKSLDDTLSLEIMRQSGGGQEFWIFSHNTGRLYIYYSDTERWENVSIDAYMLAGSTLIVDQNNNVWAAKKYSSDKYHLLYQYNDSNKTFEPRYDKEFLLGEKDESVITSLQIDDDGKFWMVMANDSKYSSTDEVFKLISFDPITEKADLYYSSNRLATSIAIDRYNNIYYVNIDGSQLLRYSQSTREITNFTIPIYLPSPTDVVLFFDHNNRLWIDDSGWFDFSTADYPQWYYLVKSPIFVSYLRPADRWGWDRPNFTHDDQDGLLWFTSNRGTGWLNAKVGRWCIFTTFTSRVFEDEHHNLWIFIHGSLYKQNK